MEFIRFLFIAILVLYIIRSLVRLLLPMLFQSVVNKAQHRASNNNTAVKTPPEGKMKVDYIPKKKAQFPIRKVTLLITKK